MKLCKDCKHYVKKKSPLYDRCAARKLDVAVHLVRGDPEELAFCEETRRVETYCGTAARWFEPKETENA